MTPYKQLNSHKPDQGMVGDCFRTALGCVLDLPPSRVPHFCEDMDDSHWFEKVEAWLNENHRVHPVVISFKGPGSVREFVEVVGGGSNKHTYWLLSGTSRSKVQHSVVCRGPEIVWDPSPDETGVIGPNEDGSYEAIFFTPLVLQRRFKEECRGMHEGRLGAWHGSAWPVRWILASPRATVAAQPARTVPGAASPAPPGRPAAS